MAMNVALSILLIMQHTIDHGKTGAQHGKQPNAVLDLDTVVRGQR